ncbi:hypothetical protein BDN71DRAFT_1510493 [Pleurotus eryngii]|uniref:Uncharacterized protein n=1 Tax=Pleurotus eryngii TaxID=5323 RepID=A0A9P5ZPI8_PLEER|nr:hypothetical protein BDN71DRAFT_1510493 [Pleurotus eryngii]
MANGTHQRQTNPTLITRTRASGESAPYPDVIIRGYGGQIFGAVSGVPAIIFAAPGLDVGRQSSRQESPGETPSPRRLQQAGCGIVEVGRNREEYWVGEKEELGLDMVPPLRYRAHSRGWMTVTEVDIITGNPSEKSTTCRPDYSKASRSAGQSEHKAFNHAMADAQQIMNTEITTIAALTVHREMQRQAQDDSTGHS